MSESDASLSFGPTNFATLDERWLVYVTHLERIQKKLKEFLPSAEARETALRIYDLMLEVDDELDEILADPLLPHLYEYDGQFFKPRWKRGFHRAFDGMHILCWLSDDMIEAFFSGRNPSFAIRWLMDELGKYAWEAQVRRANWEESHHLGLLKAEVVAEIVRDFREREACIQDHPPALSPEERAFFKSFEDQMEMDETSAR